MPTHRDLLCVWGEWVGEVGEIRGGWDWYATLTFPHNKLPIEKEKFHKYVIRNTPNVLGFKTHIKKQKVMVNPGWDKPGWAYTKSACNKFLGEIVKNKNEKDSLFWLRAREISKMDGVSHYHLLIGGCKEVSRKNMWNYWKNNYGINRIEPYDKELGASYYLCKYVTKELGEVEFSSNLKIKGV